MRTYFLDTNIVLAATVEPERLDSNAHDILANTDHILLASVASLWEGAIKRRKYGDRFIATAAGLRRGCDAMKIKLINVDDASAIAVETVEADHGDPFDILIMTQAKLTNAKLLTSDKRLSRISENAELVRLKP